MSASNDSGARGPLGGGLAGGAGSAAARGAALIAVAVLIGIVLLQIVDDGSSGPVASGETPDPGEVTTTTTSDGDNGEGSTTSSPSIDVPERAPEEVRVLVLNSGGPSGSAGNMSEALKSAGYVNQPSVAADDTEVISGNAVMCREGFEREADTLAIDVGSATQILPLRDPEPETWAEADCVVLVGGEST